MKKGIFTTLLLLLAAVAGAQQVGLFEASADVGLIAVKGNASCDPMTQQYRLRGAGTGALDGNCHLAWKLVEGNFLLQSRASFNDEKDSDTRQLGWMVRSSDAAEAAMVCATLLGSGKAALQVRRTQGGPVEEVIAPVRHPDVMQLEKREDQFILSVAKFGETFQSVAVGKVQLEGPLQAGIFVASGEAGRASDAVFDYVRIVLPPGKGFVPYQDYLGSHIECLEVNSGSREIVYSDPGSVQAPNWSLDGEALLYNRQGLIYRFDLSKKETAVIPTDTVRDNNNDHVISFDGTMLGLSSSSGEEAYGSLVYTVPIGGGVPKRITPLGPSYLHGWSPDGKWLTYTGLRNGDYDIYIIPSSGGDEIRLTDAPGLDDGSEYSPDGKWIYFNSVRTGSMEIWRMRPDGSEQEQLTSDAFQNWFPHVSPDGKWVVFLSYQPEVRADDHPFYKQVYLRLMPAEGGSARTIAYLFGGQGSINTPSWSPDGKRIAFVSNSGGIE
jgi:Tol biopolymer transport system component